MGAAHPLLLWSLLFVIPIGAFARPALAQENATPLEERFEKREALVPMRDGVRLHTVMYLPRDRSRAPMLMMRTPYSAGPYGEDSYRTSLGPYPGADQDGYIFVYQDVRGKYLSEGTYVNMRPHIEGKTSQEQTDESSDTFDTIEWLLKNLDGHNGRVGLYGISYPGFYASAGAIDSHPALKAVSPQAPIADWFWDDMHRHGAFVLPLAFNFFSSFGVARPGPSTARAPRFDHGTPDGYKFFLELGPLANVNRRHFLGQIDFWNQMAAHPNYDAFWQSRNLLPHLNNVTAAVLVVGGWFDTEDLFGPLKTYQSIEEKNPDISNVLLMGPWPHGGWARGDGRRLGEADFGAVTANRYQEEMARPFFRHHLHQQGELDLPEATVFETGTNRWREFDQWPPAAAQRRRLHLREKQALAWSPATDGPSWAHDAYVSDPARPVPYTKEITTRWARDYMTEDQRFASQRPDVLVYQTGVLEEDVTLAGPLLADLWVSTSGGDSDFIVKLVDVFPDRLRGLDEDGQPQDQGSTQRLVRAEAFRGRFRNSYEHPEPFVSDQPTQVSFELWDVLHTFQKGHRIMIQVQSTWFPFIDRNPQSWVPNIFEAQEGDFVPATNRVFRSADRPSAIEVGVLIETPSNSPPGGP